MFTDQGKVQVEVEEGKFQDSEDTTPKRLRSTGGWIVF